MSDIEERLLRVETDIKWLQSNGLIHINRIEILENKVKALQSIEGDRLVKELEDIPVDEPEKNPYRIIDHELFQVVEGDPSMKTPEDEYLHNPSLNKGGYFRYPELLVIHYTAGRSYQESIDNVFMNPGVSASTHILIGKEAQVIQLVDFNTRAWHAGKSAWHGKKSVNGFSLSIELDNFGKLENAGSYYAWFDTGYKNPIRHYYTDSDTGTWEKYPKGQIDKLIQIIEVILSTYPSIKMIVGHQDISPGRKSDPGSAFPWKQLHDKGFPILDKYKNGS